MFRTGFVSIALLALANPALAAAECATPADTAALTTAVMQQQMMVAAFQCREAGAYNRFVAAYRNELQSSDAVLKEFFVHRGGARSEAGYDAFKTKAANLSALEQARHSAAFCADSHALLSAALAHRGSLMSFVESRAGTISFDNVCVASRPMLARTEARPEKMASAKEARPNSADIAIGVPDHSQPAIPTWREDRGNDTPPPSDLARDWEREDRVSPYAGDEAPPHPRSYQVRDRGYEDRGYGPPPPEWREYPAPRYGWYPREPYGRW